jgi:hypothetical protein
MLIPLFKTKFSFLLIRFYIATDFYVDSISKIWGRDLDPKPIYQIITTYSTLHNNKRVNELITEWACEWMNGWVIDCRNESKWMK